MYNVHVYANQVFEYIFLYQFLNIFFAISGITDYIKGGYLMRRAWKLYDKCYCEISSIGGPFLAWAPELRCDTNGALSSGLDDVEEALDEVTTIK